LTIRDRVKTAVQAFTQPTTKNSGNLRNARDFLKYGGSRHMTPDWSQVVMNDHDLYTGTMYGAIYTRAVRTALIATYNLKTKARPEIVQKYKSEDQELIHPYLEVIDASPTVTNFMFWDMTARRLDLKGVTYVLAVRNVAANGLVGKVQEFKLLNPYNIERIFDSKTGELLGYKEHRGGMSRDLPKDMVIPIIDLDPITDEPHAMADAAKDSQFTLKTANDYTRSAIRNNINAPGIIATDRELDGEELANFKSRVMGHQKGEPIFGGGAGSITWNDMQNDLNKSALDKINSIQMNNLIAVSGVSKTMMGIEESGTTRDTSKTQKDNFIETRAMPLLQVIIDALNQDYKNHYKAEYERNHYLLYIDNPLGSDRDAELKDVEIRSKTNELYEALVSKGYGREEAAKYAEGAITLSELGEPKEVKQLPPEVKEEPKQEENAVDNDSKQEFLQMAESGLMNQTQASLQNTIINIDNRLLAAVVNNVGQAQNDFSDQDDIISEREKKALQSELNTALVAFYGIIIPLFAYNVLSNRLEQFGQTATFRMNNNVRGYINGIAIKASSSHINTLLDSMVKQAQKDSLAGVPRDQIARNLLNKYGDEITRSRAVAIARTETNRAFTMSQYQADLQFMKQNNLEGRMFKQWRVRSDNPCSFCLAMAEQPPIPLDQPFASIGDELTATAEVDGQTMVRKMTVGFADADSGNLHTNCGCDYEISLE